MILKKCYFTIPRPTPEGFGFISFRKQKNNPIPPTPPIPPIPWIREDQGVSFAFWGYGWYGVMGSWV